VTLVGGATGSPLLEVRDLNVWFDLPEGKELHAVQGLSFQVDPGGRMGLGVAARAGPLSSGHPSRLRATAPPRAAVRPRNERRDRRLSGTA
jgi:hypothetical protein